jgi:isoquinoline 1-oxidoreductase alpha subunit
MAIEVKLKVNEQPRTVTAAPDTPLLYVLMNELDLQGPRFGCGLGQCGSCSVLVNGVETRSCMTPVSSVQGKSITTLEGLPAWYAAQNKLATAPALVLVGYLIDERAVRSGICYGDDRESFGTSCPKTPQPTEVRNSFCHEPFVPMWTYSPDTEGDPARRSADEGGGEMTTRRDFVKTGGALVVGFTLGDTLFAQAPSAAAARFARREAG